MNQPDTSSVPQPLAEAEPRLDSQASGSSSDQEAVSLPIQVQCPAEENVEAAEEDEELVTRRRHVTGDSGIEVCVCQLDVDEGSGLEEESDEEQRMCKVAGRDCCSVPQQQTLRQKEHPSELPSPTSTSNGDHMV